MNIIKLYYKIALSQWISMALYAGIFITVFIAFGFFTNSSLEVKQYEGVKPSIVVVDEDQSKSSKEVVTYLSSIAKNEEIGETQADRKDALFYGAVEMIVTIPEGFEESFTVNKKNLIRMEQRPDSSSGYMIKQNVDSFLQNIHAYQAVDKTLSFSQAAQYQAKDSATKASMKMMNDERANVTDIMAGMYFNYLSYILLVMILMVVGLTMHKMYSSEIQKRNLIAPISTSKMNSQLVIANVSFGFLVWLVFIIIVSFLCFDVIFSLKGLLYLINSLLFVIVAVCMAFFVSTLLSNKRHAEEAMNGVTNVVGLGFAFIGGAFVPQMLIPSAVLNFAHFIPTYWYVKLSDVLRDATTITTDIWKDAALSYGVLSLFAIVFLMMGLSVMKQHRSQNSFTVTSDN